MNSDIEFKKIIKYECQPCKFLTCIKRDYSRHVNTIKHKKLINLDITEQCIQNGHICKCGKLYKHTSTLSRHKKKCIYTHDNFICDEVNKECNNNNELIKILINQNNQLQDLLIKQSQEYQKQLVDIIPKINNNNNNTINSNNKLDINIFLNEKCKDALSIDQFLNKIEISLSNLLLIKDKGLIEGITNIFIENMSQLSLYERPLHCTDAKRETVYIKQDEWKKDINNHIVKDAIKQIAIIQSKNINNNWTKAYPNFMNSSKQKDDYIQLVKQSTDDINSNKTEKIIKKICKSTYINPSTIEII